ncbi:MAG: histidine kinase N-terminal 7TM domain-containing protein, partial [Synergistota bacterium]|nr:histidine kinase N-terminal 7TM domain-containing protein [Synergistota bacterium]
MATGPLVFSLLFFTAFSVYLLIGVYVIHIDRGAHLNRVFFLACVSLSVWALGFSIVNTVPDAATFFFWQRVSAVGRSVFYCFFLHFALLFARELRGEGGIRPPLPLLYLPGLVCILVFAAVPGLSSSHYALKEGPFGLICYPVVDAWTILFLVYSLGYVIAAIRAMLRASGAARDPALGRQSRLLALATGLSLLPPDILDFLLHKLLDSPFPRSA